MKESFARLFKFDVKKLICGLDCILAILLFLLESVYLFACYVQLVLLVVYKCLHLARLDFKGILLFFSLSEFVFKGLHNT